MIPALIHVSLDNCWMLECTVFLTPCAFGCFGNIIGACGGDLSKIGGQ